MQTDRDRERERLNRQADRETETTRKRQTGERTDRQTHRQTDRQRETERERERERERGFIALHVTKLNCFAGDGLVDLNEFLTQWGDLRLDAPDTVTIRVDS